MYEKKTGDWILFKNKEKKADTHADYQGDILLEDGEHYLNGWIKTAKDGSKFMAGKVGPLKGQKKEEKPAPKQEAKNFDDDIPF